MGNHSKEEKIAGQEHLLVVSFGSTVAFLPFSSPDNGLKFPWAAGHNQIDLVGEHTRRADNHLCQFVQVSQTEQKKNSK